MTETSVLAPIPSLLRRDLREAAAGMGPEEVRYLVDLYYAWQDDRKRASNQVRALKESEEPHTTLIGFAGIFEETEKLLKDSLDAWSKVDPMGRWARQVHGIGPVIAAGLSAHIDPDRCAHVSSLWRFAGLDPTSKWEKGQKRPWNAQLKVLCWKAGDSFVKLGGPYGDIYRERKAYELKRDLDGGNAETARATLEERNIRDKETREIYESGHLPAGRLDLRARRYAVKLFLSHWLAEAKRQRGDTLPDPWAIAHGGHVDHMPSPVPPILD